MLLYFLYGILFGLGLAVSKLVIFVIKLVYKEICFYIAWIKHYSK